MASPKQRISTKAVAEANVPDDGGCVSLRKELTTLAKKLQLADLRFIVAQSKVLIHNREVEELENEMAEAECASLDRGEDKEGLAALGAARRERVPIQIAKSASGNANLVLNGKFKLLTATELAAMAKIVISADDRSERITRLYRWLDRERRDIIIEGDMASRTAPLFVELFSYLEKTFAHRRDGAK
jgi:hypothetical protein